MSYQPLEKLLPKASGSIFKLVIMAAKRAKELADGAPILVESSPVAKTATVALDEISFGKVEIKEDSEESTKKSKSRKKE